MRIAVIAKGIAPKIVGGAELVTAKIVEGLKKRGHEAIVITKPYDFRKVSGLLEKRPELGSDIDLEWSEKAAKEAMEKKPDIIYICQYWGEAAAHYIDRKFPVVLMHHDIELEKLGFDKEFYGKLRDITAKSLKRADKIVVASKAVRDYLYNNFPESMGKVVINSLGVE